MPFYDKKESRPKDVFGFIMKIIHNSKKCINCGNCVSICPDFWEINEGKVRLKGGKLNEKTGNFELELENPDCNKETSETCPMKAIEIEE